MIPTTLYGGDGGGVFDDNPATERITGISRIQVRSGALIDKITIVYNLVGGRQEIKQHGGGGGNDNPEIVLAPDERICGVVLRSGSAVDSLTFIICREHSATPGSLLANLACLKRYGPYGSGGGQEHVILCPNIGSFFGRSGTALDAIGFYCDAPVIAT